MKKIILMFFVFILVIGCNNRNTIIENYRMEKKKVISDLIKDGDVKKKDKSIYEKMIDRNIDSLIDLWGSTSFVDSIITWKKQDSVHSAELKELKIKQQEYTDSLMAALYPKEWKYDEQIDEMDNSKTSFAKIYSLNSIDLMSPYDSTLLGLIVRKQKGRTSVMLTIQDGQFQGNYVSETLKIKFDDEPPINVTFEEPASNNSQIIFLGSTEKIINKLKTAKRIKIEPYFYDNGKQIFDFSVDGFNWKY